MANEREVPAGLALILRWTGLATMAGLLALVATGTWLMFFYQPSTALAWDDIDSLQREIERGLWVRSLHRWLVVLVMLPAVTWVIMFAAARMGRNVLLAATAIGASVLAAVSGLFLPWDQLALGSITAGSDMTGFTPVFGDDVEFVLIDNAVVSPATIRFWLIVHLLASLVAVVAVAMAVVLIRRSRGVPQPAVPASHPA